MTFRLVRCKTCGTETKGRPTPTLSPSVVLAYCTTCKRTMPSVDLGETEVVEPTRRPEPETTDEVDDESGMAALADVPSEAGDPLVCPSCGEVGSHDGDCPEPSRIARAYHEWRRTDDGQRVSGSIRRRALELRRRGWKHYGMKALAEVVRFDRALSVGPESVFKVNNSYLSRLARDLMAEEPDLEGFFETRELRSEEDR